MYREPTVSEITAVYPSSSSRSTSCKFGSGNLIVQRPKGVLFLSVGQYPCSFFNFILAISLSSLETHDLMLTKIKMEIFLKSNYI